jgi:hypothetical protein
MATGQPSAGLQRASSKALVEPGNANSPGSVAAKTTVATSTTVGLCTRFRTRNARKKRAGPVAVQPSPPHPGWQVLELPRAHKTKTEATMTKIVRIEPALNCIFFSRGSTPPFVGGPSLVGSSLIKGEDRANQPPPSAKRTARGDGTAYQTSSSADTRGLLVALAHEMKRQQTRPMQWLWTR